MEGPVSPPPTCGLGSLAPLPAGTSIPCFAVGHRGYHPHLNLHQTGPRRGNPPVDLIQGLDSVDLALGSQVIPRLCCRTSAALVGVLLTSGVDVTAGNVVTAGAVLTAGVVTVAEAALRVLLLVVGPSGPSEVGASATPRSFFFGESEMEARSSVETFSCDQEQWLCP